MNDSTEKYITDNDVNQKPIEKEPQPNILDLLAIPESAHYDFEFPKMNFQSKPVDFD